jgi:opacity protein-like surface antigen
VVVVDNRLVLTDLFIGGFVSTDLSRKARIYAGAGPMLLVGYYKIENEEEDTTTSTFIEEDETESAVGAGLYARAGIEFRVSENTMLGLGIRAFRSDLDFEDTVGRVDVEGVQAMLTYTMRF